MFCITPSPTFTIDVNLSSPGSDKSTPVSVTFRHKGAAELKLWQQQAQERKTEAEFLGEVIAGWSGFVDQEGAPVDYTPAALEALLDAFPSAGSEFFLAYHGRLTRPRAA